MAVEPAPSSASVQTATGTGTATFAASTGCFQTLTAVSEGTIPSGGKPNLAFPHAFFSFKIGCLAAGATVTITITLPSNVPVGTQFWKFGPTPDNPTNHWYQIPIGDDDDDNVITITITDGATGDDDLTANAEITDQGGPGQPITPTPTPKPVGGVVTPVNKLEVLAPYLALAGLIVAVSAVVIVRRRHEA